MNERSLGTPERSERKLGTATQSVAALQYALAGEHAAVYGYGLLAARLSGAHLADALLALDHHRGRRDQLRALVAAAGAAPQEAAPAYRPTTPATSAATAINLAADIERDVAVAYGRLVAATADDTRTSAARWVQEAAVQQSRWRHAADRFPGLEITPTATPSPAPTR
jgi:uncharacterized protein DUF4439